MWLVYFSYETAVFPALHCGSCLSIAPEFDYRAAQLFSRDRVLALKLIGQRTQVTAWGISVLEDGRISRTVANQHRSDLF